MSTRRKPEGERITINDNGVELTVQCNARADLYSTFRVGGNADYLVRAGTEAEARLALAWAAEQGLPVTVFGGTYGSSQESRRSAPALTGTVSIGFFFAAMMPLTDATRGSSSPVEERSTAGRDERTVW